ncbi:FixH family protein [Siminovitchia sediminis]|uniref:FixH family protein n=1 Tax=Siminovitchia sediminis TaxID=1274353 RepID=A0ABW4KIJ0_9BACI
MKKSLLMILTVILLVFGMAACGNGSNGTEEEEIPQPLEVELEVQETAGVGESVSFKATVTQGEEAIKDADEVVFEVWEEGKKDDSEMIDAKNNKDGTYEAEKSFDHDGVFTVQVHVTARGLHTMPKKSVTVGEGAPVDDASAHHHEGHGDHHEGFGMHFEQTEELTAGKETELMVHLQDGDHPMEGARVRFEIWHENEVDQHEFVDAKESQAGEYIGSYDFNEAGKYTIQVHVENDDGLHEHEEHQVEVK